MNKLFIISLLFLSGCGVPIDSQTYSSCEYQCKNNEGISSVYISIMGYDCECKNGAKYDQRPKHYESKN